MRRRPRPAAAIGHRGRGGGRGVQPVHRISADRGVQGRHRAGAAAGQVLRQDGGRHPVLLRVSEAQGNGRFPEVAAGPPYLPRLLLGLRTSLLICSFWIPRDRSPRAWNDHPRAGELPDRSAAFDIYIYIDAEKLGSYELIL